MVETMKCRMEENRRGFFTDLTCSECGNSVFLKYEDEEEGELIAVPYPRYCPYCGAKVDDENPGEDFYREQQKAAWDRYCEEVTGW